MSGRKNGDLLTAAESAGFQVIVTTGREIAYQQNLDATPRAGSPLVK